MRTLRERDDFYPDADPEPGPMARLSDCGGCGKRASLTYTPSERFVTTIWRCPYSDCRRVQKIDLQGSIFWVGLPAHSRMVRDRRVIDEPDSLLPREVRQWPGTIGAGCR
jgi:hypothetical protein